MSKAPKIPNAGDAAAAGIQADTALQPFQYLINAASTLGQKINIGGKDYDFTGLGAADTSGKISDSMAQTLLDLQKEKAPEIIAQRIEELKASDPQGYAARKQLFDRIIADSQANPNRPVSTDLQKSLQDELSKGAGFNDSKQEQEVRDSARGAQVMRGIYLGESPTSEEAKTVVNAGESLRSQREQNALNLLQSGSSPEDVAYRQFQQSIGNLADFTSGQSPTAQFQQVSASQSGPVSLTGQAPGTNTFNPNAGGQGASNALSMYGAQANYNNSQANPWLAGLSIAGGTIGSLKQQNPSWFGGGGWSDYGQYRTGQQWSNLNAAI